MALSWHSHLWSRKLHSPGTDPASGTHASLVAASQPVYLWNQTVVSPHPLAFTGSVLLSVSTQFRGPHDNDLLPLWQARLSLSPQLCHTSPLRGITSLGSQPQSSP